jgi:iron(III) transport system ATP-binding protein
MSAIEVRAASKRFGATPVLSGVELRVEVASVTAVLGGSGSGKTTLLRLIAGFERLDGGSIRIRGRVVDDSVRTVSPQHRGIGYVPQEGALFPHLTVRGNVSFGLPWRSRAKADELLQLTGLSGLDKRYPHQLSGGQQQRVALARALAVSPQVVLLDEPFSALDSSLRDELRRDVAAILRQAETTAILVTHDQDEALALADQLVLLAEGRVRAAGEPRALYRNPPDLTTAAAIGEANLLPAEIADGLAHCALGSIPVRPGNGLPPSGRSRLLIRPEQLALHPGQTQSGVSAVVRELQYHGHDALARISVCGLSLVARVPGDVDLAPGDQVWLEVVGPGTAWPEASGRNE